jgi:RHH-type rel operon transcriptional repressor/antitoxin RelB
MLGVRLDPETERALDALARRTHRSKSEIARDAITRHVREHDEEFLAEARRQSLRVAGQDRKEDWDFLEAIEAEDGGWK